VVVVVVVGVVVGVDSGGCKDEGRSEAQSRERVEVSPNARQPPEKAALTRVETEGSDERKTPPSPPPPPPLPLPPLPLPQLASPPYVEADDEAETATEAEAEADDEAAFKAHQALARSGNVVAAASQLPHAPAATEKGWRK
jgi:type IV secretory pathway VirB10-like protein